MGFYAALMDAIHAYTGLSPAAFFTILALSVMVYKTVCGMFVGPEEFNTPPTVNGVGVLPPSLTDPPPVSDPVQLGDVTEEELRAYNGSDPSKPLLMAIQGQIYDVSRSRMFYGPGGPYGIFAGREAARALALLSFDPRDLTADLEGLGASELEVLQDWEDKFVEKYAKVGQIVSKRNDQQSVADIGGGKAVEESEELEAKKELKAYIVTGTQATAVMVTVVQVYPYPRVIKRVELKAIIMVAMEMKRVRSPVSSLFGSDERKSSSAYREVSMERNIKMDVAEETKASASDIAKNKNDLVWRYSGMPVSWSFPPGTVKAAANIMVVMSVATTMQEDAVSFIHFSPSLASFLCSVANRS
ncbi:unnamed protein product [Linum tenue]|uniref:Cytochrome b5 heme-binding domain-containing protein n=1 Tax=Linum tenue TaxID=586396 RepID=A0AAV0IVB8_9ROSI|nr:unnamed protein product [Linum tenue]